MSAHPFLYNYLWFAPHVLLVVLAIMLVKRGLAKEFPAFFLYTVYEGLQFVVIYTLYRMDSVSGVQYTEAWLAGVVGSCCLRFAIIQEIFRHVFGGYPAFKSLGARAFRWTTGAMVLGAVTLVAFSSGNEMDRLTLACTFVDRAVSAVQCGMLVVLFLMSRFLGLPWRTYEFGIAAGLGLFASTNLAVSAIRSQIGLGVKEDFFGMLTMAFYHACVLLWVVTLLLPQPQEQRSASVPVHDLEEWNAALQRLLQQ